MKVESTRAGHYDRPIASINEEILVHMHNCWTGHEALLTNEEDANPVRVE